MIVSEARREANRRNSLKSTGPRTAQGKARVRANAVKHGMTAETVVDAEAFRIRAAEWHQALQPTQPAEVWIADEVARITLKLDRSHDLEQTLRDQAASRAEVCWDADRRVEVEALARGISDRPGQVVAGLRQTVQGCEFLIGRWAMLAHIADLNGSWDEGQVDMVFDLLGTPSQLRGPNPCVRIDTDGRSLDPGDGAGPAAFARAEITALKTLRDHLEPLDDLDQSATAADLIDLPTPEIRRFRRYQTALQNRLKWCLKQLQAPKTSSAPRPVEMARPAARPIKVETPVDRDDEADDDEETDAEMMAWLRAEAAKAGFSDLEIDFNLAHATSPGAGLDDETKPIALRTAAQARS